MPVQAADAGAANVDFHYSPPEWQTAICLPDDSFKSLVDRSGELLYHYGQGGREFATRIGVEVASGAVWQKQELVSPRVPIVRTLRLADGLEITEEAFAVTGLRQTNTSASILQRLDSGGVNRNWAKPPSSLDPSLQHIAVHMGGNIQYTARPGGPARNDLVLVRVANQGGGARTLQPQLIVDTTLPFSFQPGAQRAVVNDHETITTSLKMTRVAEEKQSRRALQLEALTVPAGKSATFFVLYSGGGSIVVEPGSVEQALASRDRAVSYWEKAPLPFGRVQVPDAGIQALVDSSIRNIWQAREIKNGLPAFQVGPTCYRGLWIVDGSFLLESAALVGAGQEARNGVAYELTFQKPDGRIEVMQNFSKENGIVLWTCVRHAQLTQDKAWLESLWPKLERVAGHIKSLRQRTLENDTPLDDGLVPPGFPDGGIGGVHAEYTNPYWNLLGLKAFILAAHWLGKSEEAATWQREYDAFMAAYRKAAQRDLARDSQGHAYVPIIMGEAGKKELPQRAQWAFCHAVYPGQIFAPDDPLVASTLAMLEATEREGMVYGTGWDATGIWNYFASFYAHAWLWQGNGRKAAQILYAYANHASPTLVWREEQSLKGEKFKKVGDMPHNWASAEFIRLTIHLLALDRGNELHLLEGFPRQWAGAGMITRLNQVATPFGPLDLTVQIGQDGKTARLEVKPLSANCRAVIVHLPGGGTKQISAQQGGTINFPVGQGTASLK
jgi:hypothetical protein